MKNLNHEIYLVMHENLQIKYNCGYTSFGEFMYRLYFPHCSNTIEITAKDLNNIDTMFDFIFYHGFKYKIQFTSPLSFGI